MTTSDYRDVLRSARWKRLKWRRIIKARFRCERCGLVCDDKRSRNAMKWFHLHHVTYRNVGRETLEDVQILCPVCHLDPATHPWR